MPQALASEMKEGDTIPLTGCTAFTFYESVSDQYKDSSWTKQHSKAKAIPCVIELERTQEFDDTIAGWHHSHDGKDIPAFEIVSGANALEIQSVERINTRIAVEARGGLHAAGRSRPDMSDQFDPKRIVLGKHDDDYVTRMSLVNYMPQEAKDHSSTLAWAEGGKPSARLESYQIGFPMLVRVPPTNPSDPDEWTKGPDPNLPGLEVGGLWTIEEAPFAGKKIGEVIQGKDIEPLLHQHYADSIRIKAKGVLE